jgi:ABC-type phosphate transport system substrate-binding protein
MNEWRDKMKMRTLYVAALVLGGILSGYAQVAVVANKSVPVASVQTSQLTDIYSLRTKAWSNGTAVVPLTLKSENATVEKVFSAMGKSFGDMKKLWMKLQLTGEGQAPEGFNSEDELLEKVASTPGAIGFVSADKASDKVKVLLKLN